jgi:hypothetical protein
MSICSQTRNKALQFSVSPHNTFTRFSDDRLFCYPNLKKNPEGKGISESARDHTKCAVEIPWLSEGLLQAVGSLKLKQLKRKSGWTVLTVGFVTKTSVSERMRTYPKSKPCQSQRLDRQCTTSVSLWLLFVVENWVRHLSRFPRLQTRGQEELITCNSGRICVTSCSKLKFHASVLPNTMITLVSDGIKMAEVHTQTINNSKLSRSTPPPPHFS